MLAQTWLAIVMALGIAATILDEALPTTALVLALMPEARLVEALLILVLMLDVTLEIAALVLALIPAAKLVEALLTVVLIPAMLVLIVEVAVLRLARVARLPPVIVASVKFLVPLVQTSAARVPNEVNNLLGA